MGCGSGWHGDGVTKARNEPVPGGAAVGRSMTERLWDLDGVSVWDLNQVADSNVSASGEGGRCLLKFFKLILFS